MTDYTELKRAADAATQGHWDVDDPWVVYSNFGGGCTYLASTDALDTDHDQSVKNAAFIAAANPAAVLALIAENERLRELAQREIENASEGAKEVCGARMTLHALEQERDQLKAENEALRKDKDRLDALESNFWDVRYTSSPNGDAGDSSTSVEIVGSWMDEPHERVIGENYHENLRAAIDQAMLAPAYPPARPEYEYDEIPDFTPGNGNKASRRAESLGIDYDAAMGKEAKS